MADLYSRLADVGFPRGYVRDLLLPDWWEDDLACETENRRLAEMAIARTLQIPLANLVDRQAPLELGDERTVRYKRRLDVDGQQLFPSVVIARRVCELVLTCADLPALRIENLSAPALRDQILRTQPYVTVTPLVQHCWSLGIPVVHLSKLPAGARRLDGLALMVSGRPCIALASSRQSPAWLAWPLAHEVGHVVHGHLQAEDIIDVELNLNAQSPSERQANAFAKSLLYGDVPGFSSNVLLDAPTLAREAEELGRRHRVHPACVVTNYGFNMRAYDVANAALKHMHLAKGGAETIRQALQDRLDLQRLAPTDRHFLQSVTGLAEH